MPGVRTSRVKVAEVRDLMAVGHIRTWADGFGRWYAEVRESYTSPEALAKLAIWCELQDRAPRDATVPVPQVQQVGSNGGLVTYWEK